MLIWVDSLELEFNRQFVSYATWVLGIKLRSSVITELVCSTAQPPPVFVAVFVKKWAYCSGGGFC